MQAYRSCVWEEVRQTEGRVMMSAKRLREIAEGYFTECEEKGRFPTEAGLMLALGMNEEDYERCWDRPDRRRVLEAARLRRMDWLENQMVTESGKATGCMNALKQEKNGGYVDKAGASQGAKQLVVLLEGLGPDAAG